MRAFLQELPSRRLPRVEPGETALAAVDVVLPMVPGGYALSVDVVGKRSNDLKSPLLLPVEVQSEREAAWNPRGRERLVARIRSFAPCAQNLQALLD